MKSTTIEVPRDGAAVQLILRPGASPAQAVIVATDDVEVRFSNIEVPAVPAPAPEAHPARTETTFTPKSCLDHDGVLASLVKLNPRNRTGAVNAIRTMFQFTSPISAQAANKMLDDLHRHGDLNIHQDGSIEFVNR